jgi:hypothetical protein
MGERRANWPVAGSEIVGRVFHADTMRARFARRICEIHAVRQTAFPKEPIGGTEP